MAALCQALLRKLGCGGAGRRRPLRLRQESFQTPAHLMGKVFRKLKTEDRAARNQCDHAPKRFGRLRDY
jgi:hypothetical protein